MDLTTIIGQVPQELVPFAILAFLFWEVIRRAWPFKTDNRNEDDDETPGTPEVIKPTNRAIG